MKQVNENELPLQQLIPAFQYDRMVIKDSRQLIEKAKDIQADVFLLGGSKSQSYLKLALDTLSGLMPHAKRVELKNQGHLAADNSGKPLKVGYQLLPFFKGE
jgi:hypothetical protein